MKLSQVGRRAELEQILEEIRGEAAPRVEQLALERIGIGLGFDEFVRGAEAWRLARAERELARLHLRELARLLRGAARLRLVARGAPATAAWRARFVEALESIAADGGRATRKLYSLLQRLVADDVARWPSAVDIVGASLALHDTGRGRRLLGQALLAEPAPHDAARVFADLLARARAADDVEALLAGLVRARQLLGDHTGVRRLKALA